jgi:hypothetical protein
MTEKDRTAPKQRCLTVGYQYYETASAATDQDKFRSYV